MVQVGMSRRPLHMAFGGVAAGCMGAEGADLVPITTLLRALAVTQLYGDGCSVLGTILRKLVVLPPCALVALAVPLL